jgi:ribosomal protein S18 acetylase RimI-like enzyme
MTALAKTFRAPWKGHSHLRPLRLPEDMAAVADLVELCFAATLDDDGRRFIRQMRRSARELSRDPVRSGLLPLVEGFVWTEEGQIVGNVNLIPQVIRRRRAFLLANVAVHPDHRQRGIARDLTEAALRLVEARGISLTALQVAEGNARARDLYLQFGFVEQAARITWHSSPPTEIRMPPSVRVVPRAWQDWEAQRRWLDRYYDDRVRWNLPFRFDLFRPGLWGWLNRSLSEHPSRQWSAHHHGRWIGSLTWQASMNQADWLWLAAPEDRLELATCALVPAGWQALLDERLVRPGRPLAVNFPAGVNETALEAVGFQKHNTLIWMEREG